ncbi:MAG: hypothetical protein CMJ32_06605 [Phycisphaerae bacterium]|nr:hypothetical protein [Phycisphaerae bacterium]
MTTSWARAVSFVLLALLPWTMGVSVAQDQDETVDPPVDTRVGSNERVRNLLGTAWIRSARALIAQKDISPQTFQIAMSTVEAAVTLDEDDLDAWNFLLDISMAADGLVPGSRELVMRSLDNITRLSPGNTVARYARLREIVDEKPTLEQRRQAIEVLLSPEGISSIGSSVAARFAFDLALLEQRSGNIEAFAGRLAQAVSLDPSYPEATAMAAGFFRFNADDPIGEIELLLTTLLANPTNSTTAVTLASLLLQHGAYVGAEDFFKLSCLLNRSGPLVEVKLIADIALAQWGRNRPEDALETINTFWSQQDVDFQAGIREANPDFSIVEISQMRSPLHPLLATILVAIRTSTESTDEEKVIAINSAAAGHDQWVKSRISGGITSKSNQARFLLEAAWFTAWFGFNPKASLGYITTAEQLFPINQDAKDKFNGLIAYRAGEYEKARQLLAPLKQGDITARLGLAMIDVSEGKTRDGARQLLEIYNGSPGSLIGLWARGVLQMLLSQTIPPPKDAAQLESLIKGVPASLVKILEDPTSAYRLEIEMPSSTFLPYQDVIIDLVITNKLNRPLSIDPSGPLDPNIALNFSLSTAGKRKVGSLDPSIISSADIFHIPPKSQLRIPVNLSRYQLGSRLAEAPLGGSNLQIRAVTNFKVITALMQPAIFGIESTGKSLRINGVDASSQWLQDLVVSLNDTTVPPDPILIAQLATSLRNLMGTTNMEGQEGMRTIIDTIIASYLRCDEVEQAWLLYVLPGLTEYMEPILENARKSLLPLVQISYLLLWTTGPDDEIFRQVVESTPLVQSIADRVYELVVLVEQQESEEGDFRFDLPEEEEELDLDSLRPVEP